MSRTPGNRLSPHPVTRHWGDRSPNIDSFGVRAQPPFRNWCIRDGCLSLGPFEYGYHYRLSRSEREHDCNPALIAGAPLDPVLPAAGPDIFLGRHDDCSRPANRQHVVHREAVVPQFVPEMPRVNHGSVFDACIELRFRRAPVERVIVHVLVLYQLRRSKYSPLLPGPRSCPLTSNSWQGEAPSVWPVPDQPHHKNSEFIFRGHSDHGIPVSRRGRGLDADRKGSKIACKPGDRFRADPSSPHSHDEPIHNLGRPVSGHNRRLSRTKTLQQGFGRRRTFLFEAPRESCRRVGNSPGISTYDPIRSGP